MVKTFNRKDFIDTFRNVFTYDDIYYIETLCEISAHTDNFSLFMSDHEYTIMNRNTRDTVSYYGQLGRYNSCITKKTKFDLTDLEIFVKELRADVEKFKVKKED